MAAQCWGMLATRDFRHSAGIPSQPIYPCSNSSQRCFMGLQSRGFYSCSISLLPEKDGDYLGWWDIVSPSWWQKVILEILPIHYSDVIMSMMASQITSISIVYSTICSGTDQRKYQSSMSLAFVREIHWWPVNSPHKGPVTRKMFPLDDIIMWNGSSVFCRIFTCASKYRNDFCAIVKMSPYMVRDLFPAGPISVIFVF